MISGCYELIISRERGGDFMPSNIQKLLQLYREKIEEVLGSHIKRVILYGSYARGDFRADSDIDIMILVDTDATEMAEYEKKICDVTYDFNYEHETDIMPIVQEVKQFDYWKKAYMFYRNVETEGVAI